MKKEKMIKIKEFAFELIEGGSVRNESQVFIEAEDAISALEEQAPKVLKEWAEKNYVGNENNELEIRKTLWLGHGHEFSALYGDDGEMQCQNCKLSDYKKEPLLDLVRQALEVLWEEGMREYATKCCS